MELSSYLRPSYAKYQQRIYSDRMKEELFTIYQTILEHQLYDQHNTECLTLPIDSEGLNGEYSPMEDYIYQIFEFVDGTLVAKKLVNMMKMAGWKISHYIEDGTMIIETEEMDNGQETNN